MKTKKFSKDDELINKMVNNISKEWKIKAKRHVNIEVEDFDEDKEPVEVCDCSNEEPCECKNPEMCECGACKTSGLYYYDEPYIVDDEEKKTEVLCDNETRKERFDEFMNGDEIRHSDMFVSEMQIDFERMDLPAVDEIVGASINYDQSEGKQILYITVKPLGHDTYLDKFLIDGQIGEVYLKNNNIDVKKNRSYTLLSEDAFVRAVYCDQLIGRNDKQVIDLCTSLEYDVEIEL